ncbi:MAG: type IA DNA topoisomerase [Lachnospiraceae bacterium]|jgi:DNA topoisomerase-3|nr:type IA DNA topoisomerase [Lachnospiraceae bacterium]
MSKRLFIAEKPSVGREFAKALSGSHSTHEGYLEGTDTIVTWCIGHLVTMSYPDVYDPKYKRWSLETLPFLPTTYRYELIGSVRKQFDIVRRLLRREDVAEIYVCTDSGREGEYIYRLVEQMADIQNIHSKIRKRVWIDSQTTEEIIRGIQEAKDLSAYDNLSHAAYLRAKEDYLMGINFSRVLTLKYGNAVKDYLHRKNAVIAVGRVMTCVLGMIVSREREIRAFVKTPFYRLIASVDKNPTASEQKREQGNTFLELEWKSQEGSFYWESPLLYKETGFRRQEEALSLRENLLKRAQGSMIIEELTRKKETKNPPLLYNLAELQNDCARLFKISPDETLRIVQELYEKKMVTYPRTDARVLSGAVSKEIHKNIQGLQTHPSLSDVAKDLLTRQAYQGLSKSRYVDDKQITDHFAIIPTGQGVSAAAQGDSTKAAVYDLIVRRFLSIFLPPAVYQKWNLCAAVDWTSQDQRSYRERFFATEKVLLEQGYLALYPKEEAKQSATLNTATNISSTQDTDVTQSSNSQNTDIHKLDFMNSLRKGQILHVSSYDVKEGETTPPKRYNSGSMILAMENAGQLIEDEELRAQIKGSGIGTSATRAEILKKLVSIEYINLHKKTQVLTPTLMGEMIYDVVDASIRPLLDPALTASWEKGLTMVAEGAISEKEYQTKLYDFVARRTNYVKDASNASMLFGAFSRLAPHYAQPQTTRSQTTRRTK